jgi:hypothetical protein
MFSMNQSNLSERAEKMSMIRGIKMELKECHMTVQTMGRDTFHTDWKPGLKIEVKGMVVQSVNNKWEVSNYKIGYYYFTVVYLFILCSVVRYEISVFY